LTFLLELCLLDFDRETWSEFSVVQHVYGHVNRLNHRKPDPCIPFRHTIIICIDLDLLLSSVRVKSDDTTSDEKIMELFMGDVRGEALDIDVSIHFCLIPLTLLVL
jgi:hypothetical protein